MSAWRDLTASLSGVGDTKVYPVFGMKLLNRLPNVPEDFLALACGKFGLISNECQQSTPKVGVDKNVFLLVVISV